MTHTLNMNKKLVRRVNSINNATGTNHVLTLDYVRVSPYEDRFDTISSRTFYLGRFKLFSVDKLRHKTGKLRIYGVTWSKFFVGVRWGLNWYHICVPKWHKGHCLQLLYSVESMGVFNLKRQGMLSVLDKYMHENRIELENEA